MSNKELVTALNDLAGKLTALDDVDDKLAKNKFDLQASQVSLDSVKKELSDTQTGLSEAQKKNSVAYDESIREKYKELEEVKKLTLDAKQKLDSAIIDLKATQDRHNQVEASLNNLRQKFS